MTPLLAHVILELEVARSQLCVDYAEAARTIIRSITNLHDIIGEEQ